MAKSSWSHSQIYVFLGFGSALCLVIFSVFLDRYVNANMQDTKEGDSPSSVIVQTIVRQIVGPTFDFDSDDSYQRVLNSDKPFTDINYAPADLAPINSVFTANSAKHFKLRKDVGDSFADMAWHFRNTFSGDKLYIMSAYRSKAYQDNIVKKGCRADTCAKGGTSEHQAGLAVDLRVVTKRGSSISMEYPNKYTDWLHEHASEWGFHNTYQKGVAIDGKIVEPRHRRYLGTELATLLQEKGETIAEYYSGTNN